MSNQNYCINNMPTSEILSANCAQYTTTNYNNKNDYSNLMETESASQPPPPPPSSSSSSSSQPPSSNHHLYNEHLPNNNLCDNYVSSVYSSNEALNDYSSYLNANNLMACGMVTEDDTTGIHSQYVGSFNDYEKVEAQSSEYSENVTNEKCNNTPSLSQQQQQPLPPTTTTTTTTAPYLTTCNNGKNLNMMSGNNKTTKQQKKKIGSGRGRPRKALVAMYHSQISGDKNTIKIRIKKSNLTAQVQLTPNKKKSGRRKRRKVTSDTDISDYEQQQQQQQQNKQNTMNKNFKLNNMSNENIVTSTQDNGYGSLGDCEPLEQSVWGNAIPENILFNIFQLLCQQDGCLPNLIKLCKVCQLWRNVALSPLLWKKVDLNYVKEKFRTDFQLHWLIYNRLQCCEDLNLGEWKVRDVNNAIEAICKNCPQLKGLNLSGWKGLNAEGLKYLTNECKNLKRLDLSSINSTSAINAQPLVALGQTMGSRLTHLVLAHNKMAGFTQIINSFATNCPNLQLLDISNIRTFAHNSALLHVEKLQSGCPKLRVLRITNSQIWLASASLNEQVASPGFPALEELSLAGLEEDQTTTSRSVDDDGIERILKNSTKLRLLDVRGCIRLTDSGLVKVPAWDLEHLFLSACHITRTHNSGLELILQKWSHSLLEVDLAWSTATESLDAAVKALAEKKSESKLRSLNLCGSSVSLDAVKAVLTNCLNLHSINLQSCRALPRGIKRLYTGSAVIDLKNSLNDRSKNEIVELDNEQSPAQNNITNID